MASVTMPAGMGSAGEWLPEMDIKAPPQQRRLTVFFRILLLIPQYFVLLFLGIATFFVAIFGWFAALFTGRLPEGVALYLSQYIEYYTRVAASESLLVDKYPPFALMAPDYPVQVELRPGELNRLAVLLRIVLIIPAAIIQAVVAGGWAVASFVIWLVVLVMGRMPESLFDATAAVLRYSMRVQAYWLMLTSSYPKRLFGDGQAAEGPGAVRVQGTRPLLMTSGARLLMVVFIVLGVVYLATGGSVTSWTSDNSSATSNAAHR
jgi:uncharacterized protein DUF4389